MAGNALLQPSGDGSRSGRGSRLDWVLVGILTAAGSGLRLAYLLRVPPFLDEYSSILTGMSILHTGGVPRLPSGVLYPSGSLFSYLEAAFLGLFGFSDLVARLPSLLLGTLTLPVLYVVARHLLGRRAALLSVVLLAFAPEAVVWGGRARMYALLQLLVLLAVYSFYRGVLDADPGEQAAPRPAWLWVLFFLGAIFSQDEAILLLPVFWLAALAGRGLRWLFRPRALFAQFLLPLAGVAARYWLNQIRVPGEVYTLVHDAFFRFPPALAHGLKQITPFFTAPGAWPVALFFLVALGFLVRDWASPRDGIGTLRSAPDVSALAVGRSGNRTGISRRLVAPAFLAGILLGVAAAIVLVVNTPWQDDRYLFMVLPLFLMVAAWGFDRAVHQVSRHWPRLRETWAAAALVLVVSGLALPAAVQAVSRFEPDYSAAYRWLAPQFTADDRVATMRPAPAAVYLGRCDFLVAEDKHQEFIMRIDGQWVDRWTGAQVIETPEAFRDRVLGSGHRVWFVIDEDRLESAAYSPEFVGSLIEQMDLVWRDGGVLVFRGQGYEPGPDMEVMHSLDVSFGNQLRLTDYALSTDRPGPGEPVTLDLYWQSIQPERNYAVFVHVVGIDGQGLIQTDGVPFLGLYDMTTHWPRDRAVRDRRQLDIPADTPPGRYRLVVGLYDAGDPDASRVPIQGTAETSLLLDFLLVDVVPPGNPSQPVASGDLGGVVRLEGYDPPLPLQVAAGTTLPLTLTWQSLASMDADYTVFLHLIPQPPGQPRDDASAGFYGDDGQPLAQADGQPLGGAYPTRYWNVGERLADPYRLEIGTDVPPAEYELRAGMYLLFTGKRLPLLAADGQVLGDHISLGTVEVTEPGP